MFGRFGWFWVWRKLRACWDIAHSGRFHAYGYGLRPNRTYGMAAQVRFVGLVTLV